MLSDNSPVINLPVYDKEKCSFFALGRNAIYAACVLYKIKAGDEILTPAFDCDGSLQPFRVLGCKLSFYRSDPYTFAVDLDDIARKITPQTRLIHIINHFGMPQPWDKILSLKQRFNIPIIEDNAYSLFSQVKGQGFGSFGDISVFSLRKNLPLVDGGMLRINSGAGGFNPVDKKVSYLSSAELLKIIYFVKEKAFPYKAPFFLRILMRKFDPALDPLVPLYSDRDGYPLCPSRDTITRDFLSGYLRPISALSMAQLKKISQEDIQEICKAKVFFYQWLVKELLGIKGLNILWPVLADGIIPFCLTFLIERKRDDLFFDLRKRFDVMAWPTLPGEVLGKLNEFSEVRILGKQSIQINLAAQRIVQPGFIKRLEALVGQIHKFVKNG